MKHLIELIEEAVLLSKRALRLHEGGNISYNTYFHLYACGYWLRKLAASIRVELPNTVSAEETTATTVESLKSGIEELVCRLENFVHQVPVSVEKTATMRGEISQAHFDKNLRAINGAIDNAIMACVATECTGAVVYPIGMPMEDLITIIKQTDTAPSEGTPVRYLSDAPENAIPGDLSENEPVDFQKDVFPHLIGQNPNTDVADALEDEFIKVGSAQPALEGFVSAAQATTTITVDKAKSSGAVKTKGAAKKETKAKKPIKKK